MSRLVLNPKWIAEMRDAINSNAKIDYTSSFNLTIKWLIVNLTKACRAFKLYNLGAGVKRVTTDTNTCPCCKKKL